MRALITGVTGMDGSHLASMLAERGHEVHGVVRRVSNPNYGNIQSLINRDAITLHHADMSDMSSLNQVVAGVAPDWVFNLAAQSFVARSFSEPEHTMDITGLGPLRLFEAVRRHAPKARVYQASSSEMFGSSLMNPLTKRGRAADMNAPFAPCSVYGVAKLAAHHTAHTYRRAYGLFISCGILFNHESSHRSTHFVTRKITHGIARLKYGLQDKLELGNLTAVRDWGYSPDYCDAMVRILENDEPEDLIIATGEGHSVAEWLLEAAKVAGMADEIVGPDGRLSLPPDGQIQSVERERRPTDIDWLVGNPAKASRIIKWVPKTRFKEIVRLMVEHDLELAKLEAARA